MCEVTSRMIRGKHAARRTYKHQQRAVSNDISCRPAAYIQPLCVYTLLFIQVKSLSVRFKTASTQQALIHPVTPFNKRREPCLHVAHANPSSRLMQWISAVSPLLLLLIAEPANHFKDTELWNITLKRSWHKNCNMHSFNTWIYE